MTPPRNQLAKLARLYDAGVLTLPMLRAIDIRHQPSCPARNPRTLDCTCDPAIWCGGTLIYSRPIVERRRGIGSNDFSAPWKRALELVRNQIGKN